VDFNLVLWPTSSGVRVGLVIQDPAGGAVERVGFVPNDFPTFPRETYLTDFGDGVQGAVLTISFTGTLRMVRTGGVLAGYDISGSNWVLIHSGPATTADDVHLGFGAWGHNNVFGNQNVTVAFDNFVLNSGRLDCPTLTLTPNNGELGTQVQVQGLWIPNLPLRTHSSFDLIR